MRLDVLFAWAVFDTEVTEESNLFLFWPLKKNVKELLTWTDVQQTHWQQQIMRG